MEDTQVDSAKETEELFKDYDKKDAELKEGATLSKSDGMEMRVASIKDGGKIKVYDNRTGDESWCLWNKDTGGMLPVQLKKRRDDGTLIFTTVPPVDGDGNKIVPPRGIHKCMLHKDNPNRKKYDEWGLATCPKDNLSSPYEVIRHMQKRHKVEYGAIEHERTTNEKEEDRAFQRELMGMAAKGKEKAPLYVSDKEK